MKIKEVCTEKEAPISFADLKPGDVFKTDNGDLLLKVKQQGGDNMYAVNLKTSVFSLFFAWHQNIANPRIVEVYPNAAIVLNDKD